MSKKILAFDFGGSSGRAMIGEYDSEQKLINVEEIHRFNNDTVLVNGHMYWDILRLFFEVKNGIRKAFDDMLNDFAQMGMDPESLEQMKVQAEERFRQTGEQPRQEDGASEDQQDLD